MLGDGNRLKPYAGHLQYTCFGFILYATTYRDVDRIFLTVVTFFLIVKKSNKWLLAVKAHFK